MKTYTTHSPRDLVTIAVLHCYDIKLALSGNRLFEHQHSKETNERNRKVLERRMADQKAIVRRLYQTRHFNPTPR